MTTTQIAQAKEKALSTVSRRNDALNKMVESKKFKARCPSTHKFLADLNARIIKSLPLSENQSYYLGKTLNQYIPEYLEHCVGASSSVVVTSVEVNTNVDRQIVVDDQYREEHGIEDDAERAESLRHAENDGE